MASFSNISPLARTTRAATILIVEDDPILRFSLAMDLRQAGFRVREAANGDEAEILLDTGAPIDLVITDIEMPGGQDGLALARMVRARKPEVPIIVVSATLPEHGIVGVADAFFGKPYDPDRLIERVRSFTAVSSRRCTAPQGCG